MKVILRKHRFPLFIALLLLTTQVFAEGPLTEKKKTYTKSYPVSNSDKISLTNQFGEMKISTWDKNEVSVVVTITAEAKTDERAQSILDNISIEDGKNGEGVYFKTKMDKNKDNNQQWSKGEKQGFRIDYEVNLPARNPLQVKNEFGPMTIGDYSGEVTLESKFGSLTTGKLSNEKRVSIEFGKGTIGSINNGSLVIKFSKASIDNLDGSVNAVFEYCDIAKLRVDNNTKSLTVKNSFSNLYLDLNTNISANFDISTNFGDLHNKTNFDIKEEGDNDDRHGPKFNKRYQGKAGSGSTEMKIKSEYGQITLGHNLSIDMNKEKNKDKDKKGTVRI